MDFCKQFNARLRVSRDDRSVVITVYWIKIIINVRLHQQQYLSKKATGIDKASGEPNDKVASIYIRQEIAKTKMQDLNAATLEAADMIKGYCSPILGLL